MSQRDKVWKDLRNDVYATQSEASLCNGVVFPVLNHYGWNVFNVQEVIPQYGVGGGKVDYCLKVGQKPIAFIEAKQASEDLRVHQEQLLRYSFEEGVNIAILTNGWLWWFYLPLTEGISEQRKFLTIDIKKQADDTIDEHFRTFLAKTALVNGNALEAARTVHSSWARKTAIREALPTAWLSLIEEQHERKNTITPDNKVADMNDIIEIRESGSEKSVKCVRVYGLGESWDDQHIIHFSAITDLLGVNEPTTGRYFWNEPPAIQLKEIEESPALFNIVEKWVGVLNPDETKDGYPLPDDVLAVYNQGVGHNTVQDAEICPETLESNFLDLVSR